MKRLLRLSLIIAPLLLGLLARVPAGGAEVVIPPRFVNPDTTLLRDTLNLNFDRIFVLADSLRVPPDTLRALAVRYGFSLEHLVFLTDSLHVRDVNQLGARIEEAGTGLLAAAGQQGTTFVYYSDYNIQQTSSIWTNSLDYKLVQGIRVIQNRTSVNVTELTGGSRTTQQRRRDSQTNIGWVLSPRISVGSRFTVRGSSNNNALYGSTEDNTDVQLSLETRHEPLPGLSLETKLFEGVTRQERSTSRKRGFIGELNSRVRYERGDWLAWDLFMLLTGNHARTHTLDMPFNTTDLGTKVNGSLALFQAAPISMRIDYTFDNPHNEQVPLVSNSAALLYVLPAVSRNRSVGATMRLARNSDTYVDLEGGIGDNQLSVVTGAGGSVTYPDDVRFGNDRRASVSANTVLRGWSFGSRLSYTRGIDLTPRVKQDSLRYKERGMTTTRAFESNLSRNLTPRLTARFTGAVSLDSYDYSVTNRLVDAAPTRDAPRQSWRAEGTYTASQNVRTTVSLDVSRTQDLNISGRNSASNSENRNYRAEWQWTARITPGLTANQTNAINAGYTRQLFNPAQNRLALDYTTATRLNAVVTPRLTIDLSHNAGYQPSGSYRLNRDGVEAFSPSGEGRTYLLNASISYNLTSALKLSLNPNYYYRSTGSRQDGATTLTRSDRSLRMGGRADVNINVGNRGRLTGGISREFSDQVTTNYSAATGAKDQPRNQVDYWNGSLRFSWKL